MERTGMAKLACWCGALILCGCATTDEAVIPTDFMGVEGFTVEECVIVPWVWGDTCDFDSTNRFVITDETIRRKLVRTLTRDTREPEVHGALVRPPLCVAYYVGKGGERGLSVGVYSEDGLLIIGQVSGMQDGHSNTHERYLGAITRRDHGRLVSRLLEERGWASRAAQEVSPESHIKDAEEEGQGHVVKMADVAAVAEQALELGNGIEIKIVWIPPGEFVMGRPASKDETGSWEAPEHRVTISTGFWMGKCEVTQGQYAALMGDNPACFKDVGLDAPIESVSWHDAMTFCKKLQEKLPDALQGNCVRLPTEAEWEYACKAGEGRFPKKDLGAEAWYLKNSEGKPHPVGRKQPNRLGLCDMYGNVAEMCWDAMREYTAEPQRDPKGCGVNKAIRGVSWEYDADSCRPTRRGWGEPDGRNANIGFRIVIQSSVVRQE